MERLTDNTEYCTSWADCEMQGRCAISGNCYERKLYNKLREHEDAEEQGLLIRLPCKIGNVLYYTGKGWIKELLVKEMMIRKNYIDIFTEDIECKKYAFSSGMIGKSIFLTKEEAEAALERMG